METELFLQKAEAGDLKESGNWFAIGVSDVTEGISASFLLDLASARHFGADLLVLAYLCKSVGMRHNRCNTQFPPCASTNMSHLQCGAPWRRDRVMRVASCGVRVAHCWSRVASATQLQQCSGTAHP